MVDPDPQWAVKPIDYYLIYKSKKSDRIGVDPALLIVQIVDERQEINHSVGFVSFSANFAGSDLFQSLVPVIVLSIKYARL